jgi:hypothetical protein
VLAIRVANFAESTSERISPRRDIAAAIEKREQVRAENGHDFGHDSISSVPAEGGSPTRRIN